MLLYITTKYNAMQGSGFIDTLNFYFMYMGVLPACIFVNHMHVVPKEARRGCGIPRTVVTEAASHSVGLPLEEQPEVLTYEPPISPVNETCT